MAVFVFDLGGTLMEYTGMPATWVGYYPQAFLTVAGVLCPSCTDADLQKSVERLTAFNPRISGREIEYASEMIFSDCLAHWPAPVSVEEAIDLFFQGIRLVPKIYPDTLPALAALRRAGHSIATLTDLPTAMPDELFRRDIQPLFPCFDLYVSSMSCGFRKPNPAGLLQIAAHFSADIQNLVFVGDEEKDRRTAARAGCRFVKIDRTGKDPDAIHSLFELNTN